MADITLDASISATYSAGMMRTVAYTSPTTAYYFYTDGDRLLKYFKTVDSGSSFSGPTTVSTAGKVISAFDIWYDKWTKDATGTLIHFAWMDSTDDECNYSAIDTANSDTQINSGTAYVVFTPTNPVIPATLRWKEVSVSICVAGGGDIHAVGVCNDTDPFTDFFHYSSDPDTISFSQADGSGALFETGAANAMDMVCIIPWNDNSDSADILAAYDDVSSNVITIKIFDASASSWSEDGTYSDVMAERDAYVGFDIAYRHSDDWFWIVTTTLTGNAGNDLNITRFEDSVTEAASQPVAIITNDASVTSPRLFIDQQSGDLYVIYHQGTTVDTSVLPRYDKSTDDGASWAGQTTFSEGAEGSHRGTYSGHSVGDDGGRFQPAFIKYADLDLLTNAVNGVSIAAAAGLSIPVAMHHYSKNIRSA